MNATTTNCSVPRPRTWTASRRRLRRTVSGTLGLGLLAVTCLALSAQMFTRFPNELQFHQPDAGAIVWFDYNNDGRSDVLCAGGWSGGYGNRLFRNNQDGTFTQLSELEFPGQGDHTSWATVADFNEDGFLDVFVGGFLDPGPPDQHPVVYLNQGGTGFSERVLDRAAILGGVDIRAYGVAAVDFDYDGLVDMAVSRLGVPSQSYLLKNTGGGVFSAIRDTPWSSEAATYEMISSMDYDGDREPDLLGMGMGVARPLLFRNLGLGGFERVPDTLLSTHQAGSIGSSWGDYDNDGDMDVAVSYVSTAAIDLQLFLNDGDGNFVPGFSTANPSLYVSCADYDKDGLLDLFVTEINSRCRLYRNLGEGAFEEVFDEPITQDVFGRWPMAGWGDFDNDGFMDLLVAASGSTNQLYRNSGNGNHWLRVKLHGQVSNRAAIGAVVRVKATISGQETWQMRVVQAQSHFTEIEPTFGLGDATSIDLLRIEWPSGNVQELVNQAADRILTVTENARITPVRPSSSLGGSVTLQASIAGALQWYHEGELLAGQTNRALVLTNLVAADAGRYSVVATSGADTTTNRTYLQVNTQFTKINEGSIVTDLGSWEFPNWWDYDQDSFLDLLVAESRLDARVSASAMYHNNRDGTFTRVTNDITTTLERSWMGAIGDYNNDGRDDLLVHRLDGAEDLYRNDGDGVFTTLTPELAGPLVTDLDYSTSVALADFGRDGVIDMFAANSWWISGAPARNDSLYRGNDDGSFTAMTTAEVGMLVGDNAPTGPCAWVDYDNDLWPDLWIGLVNAEWPNPTGRQYLWHNNGNGTFSRVSGGSLDLNLARGLSAWGDFDNDGYPDLFLTSFDGTNSLHRNLGGQSFDDVSEAAGVARAMVAWGAGWGDYDNDGFLDLMVLSYNGHNSVLYRNNGNGTFTSVDVGSPVREGSSRVGAAWADYDNNGFLDLLITCGDGVDRSNLLYRNNGNGNAWLKVKLMGTTSNRSAIGAKVRALASIHGRQTVSQSREISGNSGEGGGSGGLVAHFGLGDATNIMTLRIEWPSGTVQELTDVAVNQMLTIVEPRRPVMNGAFAPDGSFQIEVTTESGRTYELQASDDLGSWTTTEPYTGTGEVMRLTALAPAEQHRFYRVRSP